MEIINRFARVLPFDEAVDFVKQTERGDSDTLDIILHKSITAKTDLNKRNGLIIDIWQQLVVENGVYPSHWAHHFFVRCCLSDSQSPSTIKFLKNLFYDQVIAINQYFATQKDLSNLTMPDDISISMYLENAVRLIAVNRSVPDIFERLGHGDYIYFASLFHDDSHESDHYQTDEVYRFMAYVLMANGQHQTVWWMLEELSRRALLKSCIENTTCPSPEWKDATAVFKVYLTILTLPELDGSDTLYTDSLKDYQLLFLFHPDSFLWNVNSHLNIKMPLRMQWLKDTLQRDYNMDLYERCSRNEFLVRV